MSNKDELNIVIREGNITTDEFENKYWVTTETKAETEVGKEEIVETFEVDSDDLNIKGSFNVKNEIGRRWAKFVQDHWDDYKEAILKAVEKFEKENGY